MNTTESTRGRLLYFVTEDWYFVSHRLPVAMAAKNAGFDVYVVTRVRAHGARIRGSGLKLIPLEISRKSINPLSGLKAIAELISIYRRVRPVVVHHVAVKPVVYGTVAALVTRVPCTVNALAGLGIIFSSRSPLLRLIRPIIKIIFRLLLNRKNSRVILQNPDDVSMMCQERIVGKQRIVLIRGSGVDTDQFKPRPEQAGPPVIMLASRLLWDKGVGEFVKAARLLKAQGVSARFVVVGEGDPDNPSSIPDSQLHAWNDSGVIEWWGRKDNMPEILTQAHIICLPTFYGEGIPKVLIEAASCSRPIVTTDAPGCREIVRDGENGYLVPIRDPRSVADAIKKLIDNPGLRKKYGVSGRSLVVREFSLDRINDETLDVYADLIRSKA